MDSKLVSVESRITDILKFNDSVIRTIPDIGYTNGGITLDEIVNIYSFTNPDPDKLLTFAGLDSFIYRAGNFNAKHARMSKQDSKVLRYALMNADHNIAKNNAPFKAYYDAKMAESLQTFQNHLENAQ